MKVIDIIQLFCFYKSNKLNRKPTIIPHYHVTSPLFNSDWTTMRKNILFDVTGGQEGCTESCQIIIKGYNDIADSVYIYTSAYTTA